MFAGTRKFVTIALFTVLLIGLVNLAWWLHYHRTEQLLEQQLSRRLAAVARIGMMSLTPERVENLRLGDFETFMDISRLLEDIRSADSLSEMFVLDEDYHYLATTLLEPDSLYFLAGLNGRYIDSLLFGLHDQVVVTPSYQTGRVYLKSAFVPLSGPEGYPVAVLGVEASVDYFDSLADLRRSLWYATVLSVAGGLLLGGLFLLLQQRINRAEQQLYLGQTQTFLGRMVAVVAHELKNPLMIIRASAERLVKKTGADEAEYIEEEVDRLNEIVTGYLEFARGDASLLQSESPISFDLGELLGSIREHLTGKYPDTAVTWTAFDAPANLTITGFRRSLRQVLFNLMANGVEACRNAGKPVELALGATDGSTNVTIEITDHGGGMSRSELKKVFTPFYTTKSTGSGIGLYLSRRLITEMGGRIDLKSRRGEFTTAVIELPKQPRE